MSIREERQEEFAYDYLESDGKGILYLCPRFGKCRVAINIFEEIRNPKILIAYPNLSIESSWKEEFKITKFKGDVTFCTHLGLAKHIKNDFDIVVIDEIHLLSDNQIQNLKLYKNENILGLTGTMSSYTENSLRLELKMPVIARYSMDKAIEDGIITDYSITVHTVPLDNKVKNAYNTKIRTEKEQFNAYSHVISNTRGDTKFLRIARMRIIQNSLAKLNKTKELLQKFKNDRVLLFCGLIKISEKIGCPVFHSKSKDANILENFANGKGNHLAVVKIGNTGVTYKPLNKVIINYFDSNSENLAQKILRCMALEYNTPNKKSDIVIISSNEEVELNWLNRALEFFDPKKIKYE